MSSDQLTHWLVLPSVRLSDAGEYTAVAGSNMSKANLGVEGRDVKISEPSDRNVSVSSHSALRLVGRSHCKCLHQQMCPTLLLGLQTNLSIKPHKRSDRKCQTNHTVVTECLALMWRAAEVRR